MLKAGSLNEEQRYTLSLISSLKVDQGPAKSNLAEAKIKEQFKNED